MLLAAAALYWALIASVFGRFLGLAEAVQFVAVWSLLSVATAGGIAFLAAGTYRVVRGRWMPRSGLLALAIWIPIIGGLSQFMISLRPQIVEYRGISNLSSCQDAQGVVMDHGAKPAEIEPDTETDGTWYVYVTDEEQGAEDIAVLCDGDRLLSVSTTSLPEIPAEETIELVDLHRIFVGRVAELYGEARIVEFPDGYGSRWCFHDELPDTWRRRMFLIEDETAELYVVSIREQAEEDLYRVEVGLLFESERCAADQAG